MKILYFDKIKKEIFFNNSIALQVVAIENRVYYYTTIGYNSIQHCFDNIIIIKGTSSKEYKSFV